MWRATLQSRAEVPHGTKLGAWAFEQSCDCSNSWRDATLGLAGLSVRTERGSIAVLAGTSGFVISVPAAARSAKPTGGPLTEAGIGAGELRTLGTASQP